MNAFKYDEDVILNEINSYIESTYNQHYVNTDNGVQLIDLVSDAELLAFAKISAMKYIERYGKKEGANRKDLLKAVHYVIMMLRIDTNRKGGK